MSYTPGPWKLGKRERLKQWIDGETWSSFASIYVCVADYDGSLVEDPEGAANARLIAAAPDMADVARMVLRYAEQSAPELVQAATEALRKAGEIPGEVGG